MTKARNLADNALTTVSPTELGYLDGVTSAVQTQIDAKLATATASTTYLANALVDAKGDVLTATADNTPARLAVGTDGQVLTAASGQSTGLQWATPSSGGWTLLASGSVSSSGVNLTGIAGNSYQELVLRVRDCIATQDGVGASMTVNGLTGASDYKYIRSGLTTANSLDAASNSYYLNYIAGSGSNAGGTMYIKFLNPAASTGGKKQVTTYSYDTNYGYRMYTWGDVNTSAQITSINFISYNLTSGTYALYGVK